MQQTIISQGYKKFRLDKETKRITFLDQRFYFTDDGQAVPSVTTILEAYPKGAAFYEWLKRNGEDADQIRDDAGKRGSKVHAMTEAYDRGETVSLLTAGDDLAMGVTEWNMFEKYAEFRNKYPGLVPLHIEQNFVNAELGFGGTVDRVFSFNGKNYLIDIKTSSMVHAHYWLQLSAYKTMANLAFYDLPEEEFNKNFIHGVGICWLNAKTRTDKPMTGDTIDCQGKGWQVITHTDAEQMKDADLFRATHKLWLAENGDTQPKTMSYGIEYKHQTKEEKETSDGKGLADVALNGRGPGKLKK